MRHGTLMPEKNFTGHVTRVLITLFSVVVSYLHFCTCLINRIVTGREVDTRASLLKIKNTKLIIGKRVLSF